MQRRFLEPEVEFVTAAIARVRRRLQLTFRTNRRTGDADMKVQGRTLQSQSRSAPALRHSAFLIAALTKMRVTAGSCATVRMSSVCVWVVEELLGKKLSRRGRERR
jgi:hypothetical protein